MRPNTVEPEATAALRARCHGIAPLRARLEPWMVDRCGNAAGLAALVERHGSPVNLIDPAPMGRNARELAAAARSAGIELGIYFARKANKALALVAEARRLELGIDVASERELEQTLAWGVDPARVMVSAAVKPRALLELCAGSGATVALDNEDELLLLRAISGDAPRAVPVALRLAPTLGKGRLPTRFGFPLNDAIAQLDRTVDEQEGGMELAGIHFHLDGYSVPDRVAAIDEALTLIDAARERDHEPRFLDIGGGIPMSYLAEGGDWERFTGLHRAALRGEGEPLTFEGHGLGLSAHRGEIAGVLNIYPAHQEPVRGEWLSELLAAPLASGEPVATELSARGLELRCEPGRSLLDGCGLTAARVEFRKRRSDGTWLIGLAMNRTQCRSSADEFPLDPLLLRPDGAKSDATDATGPIDGFLVGAYCIERELLSWRRLRFPEGVAVGDLIVFPNTAGYMMHILESASHQIPLARNLIASDPIPELDPIDYEPADE